MTPNSRVNWLNEGGYLKGLTSGPRMLCNLSVLAVAGGFLRALIYPPATTNVILHTKVLQPFRSSPIIPPYHNTFRRETSPPSPAL